MSKEAEKYLETEDIQNPYIIHKGKRKPLSEVLQAYADKINEKLIESIKSDPILLTTNEKELFISIIEQLKTK